ncbi:hypothetical protein [Leptospira sp. 'Mane']|uniref:hypothetical protein n=1 Tax=Leptospira sp. 'Mane' TaxID=3387407 RepID=UPI00398B55D9
MIVIKSILIVFVSMVVCGILGFVIPFVVAQFNEKSASALSFIPMITVPVGFVVGLLIGLFIVFK